MILQIQGYSFQQVVSATRAIDSHPNYAFSARAQDLTFGELVYGIQLHSADADGDTGNANTMFRGRDHLAGTVESHEVMFMFINKLGTWRPVPTENDWDNARAVALDDAVNNRTYGRPVSSSRTPDGQVCASVECVLHRESHPAPIFSF